MTESSGKVITEIVPISEGPIFQFEKPSSWRVILWFVKSLLSQDFSGTAVKKKEEYYAEQFSHALDVYERDVKEYETVVDGLKGTYEALTASLNDDEERIRTLRTRPQQSYSLDMRLLGHETESKEPQYKVFENTAALEELLNDVRTGLDTILMMDSKSFEAEYGTSHEAYRKAGEYVIKQVERELLARQEATIDSEQLAGKLAVLRARRQTIFESYKNARGRYLSFRNLLELLKIDAIARTSTIQAAAQSERLLLGSEMLLQLYERLAPVEAHARAQLQTPLGESYKQLDQQYNLVNDTAKQLKDIEK